MKQIISLEISTDLLTKIKAEAKKLQLSTSALIRLALLAYFTKNGD